MDCRVGGCLVCLLVPLAVLAAGSDLDGALIGSSVFFLPSPNSPRILFFFSGSLAPSSAAPLVAPVRTFSAFCDFGSNGSASAGAAWFEEPLCSGAVLARLIVGAGYQVQIVVLQGRAGGYRCGEVSESMVGAGRCLSLGLWVGSLLCAGSAGNLQEANDICQQTVSPEAGRVVSQWRLLIGTRRESGEISEGKQSKQARRGSGR